MTLPGVKLHVPRWMAAQAAEYLSDGWQPPRHRGPHIPDGESGEDYRGAQLRRARKIADEMRAQLARRRTFKDRPILILLRRADAVWLGAILPRRLPLFSADHMTALYCVGYCARIEGGRRRGRRIVWPDEMARRIKQRDINKSDKQIMRYHHVLEPVDDTDWPEHLKHPI